MTISAECGNDAKRPERYEYASNRDIDHQADPFPGGRPVTTSMPGNDPDDGDQPQGHADDVQERSPGCIEPRSDFQTKDEHAAILPPCMRGRRHGNQQVPVLLEGHGVPSAGIAEGQRYHSVVRDNWQHE